MANRPVAAAVDERQCESTPCYSWTQPICHDCWDERHPEALSGRGDPGETETCVHCGRSTASGIYVRVDPATADHPTLLKG